MVLIIHTATRAKRKKSIGDKMLPLKRLLRTIHACKRKIASLEKRYYSSVSKRTPEAILDLILQNTELSRDHMTPEIALHLVTKQCALWSDKGENSPFLDPFWAFYWPGGQVMTRYVLDNPEVFNGQRVLDFGSGCGASAIACKMVGAAHVLANDIDTVAVAAIQLNCKANGVNLKTDTSNLIGLQNSDWTTIILGDMFYDETFRDIIVDWLSEHYRTYKTSIFIGDPGRLPLVNHPIRNHLTKVSECELSKSCKEENSGFSSGIVWKFEPN